MRLLATALIALIVVPVAAARFTREQFANRNAILRVWGYGARGRLALRIAWCESRWHTYAANGRHLGLFQMGATERRLYGHSTAPVGQARAALAYYMDAGTAPWRASERCWG